MARVKKPNFKIYYNKKDITANITPYLMSITYKDATEGKADTVEIEVSNTTAVWTSGWYPTMGDTLEVSIGIDTVVFNCGLFEIDEVEWDVSPDVLCIKGIAAGIKDGLRTHKSKVHEKKTLKQIAQDYADQYGFKLTGTIVDTGQISREEQILETDLAFLYRISKQYGHTFSVRAGAINFTNIFQLEALVSATEISRRDMLKGSRFKDSTYNTYKKLHLMHFDPSGKKVVETNFSFPPITNVDGFTYDNIVKEDTRELRVRADNSKQAEMKAMAALHGNNSKQQSARLVLPGNPYLVAGNNIDVTECDILSGQYHIVCSVHKLIPKLGYVVDLDVKRVGFITIAKAKRKKPKKPKKVSISVVK